MIDHDKPYIIVLFTVIYNVSSVIHHDLLCSNTHTHTHRQMLFFQC